MAITAAAIWPMSLPQGGSGRMSSTAPTSVMRAAPPSNPQVLTRVCIPSERALRGSVIMSGIQIAAATTIPARIASPPSSGVVLTARPRSRGSSTAPTRRAIHPAMGVRIAATAAATTNERPASQ